MYAEKQTCRVFTETRSQFIYFQFYKLYENFRGITDYTNWVFFNLNVKKGSINITSSCYIKPARN